MGGFDENCESLEVEVDESAFHRRKYNVGLYRPTQWVLGGVDRQTRNIFLAAVPNRTADTFLPLLETFILPGSRILTDGWAAYADIGSLQGGIYSHNTVIHADHFVDPIDDSVHTQGIESVWKDVKKKLRRQCGTSNILFESYLNEEMWRVNCARRTNVFSKILICIRMQYPL